MAIKDKYPDPINPPNEPNKVTPPEVPLGILSFKFKIFLGSDLLKVPISVDHVSEDAETKYIEADKK